MSDFFLLRHGETDWNVQNRMQGQIQDVPLNSNGITQAYTAADLLVDEKLDILVSSTLDRAVMTSKIISEKTGVPILYDKRLIERSWGVAEGLTYDDFLLQSPEDFFTSDGRADWISKTRQPKGSETKEALGNRAMTAINDLLESHKGKRLLFVTHGAWMRALFFLMTGKDQVFANATLYKATNINNGWDIILHKHR